MRRDGKAVILGGAGTDTPGLAQVCSLEENGDLLSPSLHHAEPVVEVSFEPSGSAVRTRDARHTVAHWDIATGRPLEVTPVPDKSRLVALSPSGDHHVVVRPDSVLHLYNGRGLVALPVVSAAQWRSARFSDDGQTLLTGWNDGVRLWDVRTGLPLGPLLPFPGLRDAVFAPGRRVLTWHDTAAQLWRLPRPPAERADDWRTWLTIRTGLARSADGPSRLLDADSWMQKRGEAEARRGASGVNP